MPLPFRNKEKGNGSKREEREEGTAGEAGERELTCSFDSADEDAGITIGDDLIRGVRRILALHTETVRRRGGSHNRQKQR